MQIKDVCLDGHQRDLVLDSIRETCAYREWRLLACHVRTNHVHVVVQAREAPEKVMTDFKAYATRALNRWENQPGRSKRWARHGSTQYLWDERTVATAISYVVDEQGEPMAVFDSRK
ncbi:transposase [bacterium]|nr:transposase [bacterium]MCB9476407.1 transposase [Deltaproteobacteria bacterium]MCB9478382.1 transposase [Deltaproteobacteria bacterium]